MGISLAGLAGAGPTAADTGGSAGGTTETSQKSESAVPDSSIAGQPDSTGSPQSPRAVSIPERTDVDDEIDSVDATVDEAATDNSDPTAQRPAAVFRSTTIRKRRLSPPRLIGRTEGLDAGLRADEQAALVEQTAVPSVTFETGDVPAPDPEEVPSSSARTSTQVAYPSDSEHDAIPEGSVEDSDLGAAATAAPVSVAAAVVATSAPRSPGPVATLVFNVLSGLGWSPREQMAARFPVLEPWYQPAVPAGAARSAGASSLILPGDSADAATVSNPGTAEPGHGVASVQVGESQLDIPSEAEDYSAPATWYFPTQVDGSVEAQGVIWLQHGGGGVDTGTWAGQGKIAFFRDLRVRFGNLMRNVGLAADSSLYDSLARGLAQHTNSIVVAPTLSSLACPGCFSSGADLQRATATMFLDDQAALNASAAAAGYQGALPTEYVLAGHSAGGGFSIGVAAGTVANGAADRLLGVVMFDGVSTGVLDNSENFTQNLADLDTLDIPVYQIAAPAQSWNTFGTTTNALLTARPDQFNGAFLVDGTHIDSMINGRPSFNFLAQLAMGRVPSGNTAAVYTLSTGWINDLYVGATPEAPEYGIYAGADQPIVLGNATAIGLPSPLATKLSPFDAALRSTFDFYRKVFKKPPILPDVTTDNRETSVVAPPMTNGVTGVRTGTSRLNIPCSNRCATPSDWYFPTQPDGTVQAEGIVWLQHGFLGRKGFYSDLATQIAQQTNSIVVSPNISSFNRLLCTDCYLRGAAMQEAVASMFLDDRAALNSSANAAGFEGTLPEEFLLTGHSAGGNFATAVGKFAVGNGAADNLLGVVMFDGVSDSDEFTTALAALDSQDIPTYQIAAPPQRWNAWGETTELIAELNPDEFTGVQIDNGSHTDAVGGNWLADLASALLVGPSPPGAKDAVSTFTAGWINDIYTGNGPTDPIYGIYGNPNDGTFVPNQTIPLGEAEATTLPALPPA